MQRLRFNAGLLVLGAGWVAQRCYLPAAPVAGFGQARAVDFDPECSLEEACDFAHEVIAAAPEDLVVVATPNYTHFALSMVAARLGKTVLCEKPLLVPAQLSLVDPRDPCLERLFVSTPNRFRNDVSALLSAVRAGRSER